jgi:hypothetical protein
LTPDKKENRIVYNCRLFIRLKINGDEQQEPYVFYPDSAYYLAEERIAPGNAPHRPRRTQKSA